MSANPIFQFKDERIEHRDLDVPDYLEQNYQWAYIHPRAVHLFERQWLVNLILWGNFARLRDAALTSLGAELPGKTLQVACVYGNLTEHLLKRVPKDGELDVVDVLPIQLQNLAKKLNSHDQLKLIHGDSTSLPFASGHYDRALVFFLLHEQPEAARQATLAEALRVVKPGGEIVIVDYHRPHPLHPLYLPMTVVLRSLEPFALDLWRTDLEARLPKGFHGTLTKRTLFGGLYQLLKLTI